jgi:F-type H+-transporting ATPase subunit epsilon
MAEEKLKIKIITPERIIYDDMASAIYSKTVDGEVGILPSHISYMTALDIGLTKIEKANGVEYVAVIGGVLQVSKNQVTILSDKAELGSDIDVTRAKSSKERAEARLKSNDSVDIDKAQFALMRALVRLKAAHHGKNQ